MSWGADRFWGVFIQCQVFGGKLGGKVPDLSDKTILRAFSGVLPSARSPAARTRAGQGPGCNIHESESSRANEGLPKDVFRGAASRHGPGQLVPLPLTPRPPVPENGPPETRPPRPRKKDPVPLRPPRPRPGKGPVPPRPFGLPWPPPTLDRPSWPPTAGPPIPDTFDARTYPLEPGKRPLPAVEAG